MPQRIVSSRSEMLAAVDAGMSEKAFQAQVVKYAREHGWLFFHTYDSRRSTGGFPDLVMVRHGRLIMAELKREGKLPTQDQWEWLEQAHDGPLDREHDYLCQPAQGMCPEVYLWWPSDWDTIAKVLA